MAGKRSLNKGKNGEREVVKLLQPIVDRVYAEFEVEQPVYLQRNTLQSDRGGFDIVGLPWLAIEVKFQEQLNVNTWWKQTERQAGEGQLPILIYRQSRKPWKVMTLVHMPLDNLSAPHVCRAEMSVEDFLVFFERKLRSELYTDGYSLRIRAGHQNGS